MVDPEAAQQSGTSIARLISLLIDASGNQKARLTIFVGAGASREYGMPTTIEFARLFFQDAISKSEGVNFADDDQIETFIREFRSQLDTDLAYAFFRRVETEQTAKSEIDSVITYDRIIDLWRNGYVKLVVTTNFDSLIERRFEAYTLASRDDSRLAVLDYNDLNREDGPRTIDARILVKIAGQIDRSNMLWTESEFKENITPMVKDWLGHAISDTPIVLLGYTASEAPLAEVLRSHGLYGVSVAPAPMDQIPALQSLAGGRKAKFDHVETRAGIFIEELYERLFEQTRDPNLTLSFGRLSDRILELSKVCWANAPADGEYVSRDSLEERLAAYFNGKMQDGHRLRVLVGESGVGKSTLVRRTAPVDTATLSLIIPASEVIDSLNEWAVRLGGTTLDDICRLALLLNRSVNIVVDGLNESIDKVRARGILEELKQILDRYNATGIRALVCSRTDFWARLDTHTKRSYFGAPWTVGLFDDDEVHRAMEVLTPSRSGNARNAPSRALLRLPQNLAFALELNKQKAPYPGEVQLLRGLYQKRTYSLGEHASVLNWIAGEMRRSQSVSLKSEDKDISQRRLDSLMHLSDAGLITLNRSLVVRFSEDRMGEYYFGAQYLLEYDYAGQGHERSSIRDAFLTYCAEYKAIPDSRPGYKALFLNALAFFLSELDSRDLIEIFETKDSFARMLVRVAAVLRQRLVYRRNFLEDPVLLSVCLLSRDNHIPILNDLRTTDTTKASTAPFSFTAKLYPDAFLDFLEEQLLALKGSFQPTAETRPLVSMVSVSLMLVALRSLLGPFLKRASLVHNLAEVIHSLPKDYIVARVVEALEENSGLIFHNHPTAKLSDICGLSWRLRNDLLTGISQSIYDIPTASLVKIIKHSPPPRHVARILARRDRDDPRCRKLIQTLFESGDVAVQDFCTGLLGFLSKIDRNWIEPAERLVVRMRSEYKRNFFRRRLPGQTLSDSQYDPLVPIVTSLLHHDQPLDLDRLLPDRDKDTAFRVGRLAQKTILDFPEETLSYVGYFLQTGGILETQIKTALRIAARFFPAVFWKHMKSTDPKRLFDISGDDLDDVGWVVSQVRDYDWQALYQFMTNTAEHRHMTTSVLRTLVEAKNLEAWVEAGVDWVRAKQAAAD